MNLRRLFFGAVFSGITAACAPHSSNTATQNSPSPSRGETPVRVTTWVLPLDTTITERTTDRFLRRLEQMERQDPNRPLRVPIRSNGGLAMQADRIIQALENVSNPVTLVCEKASSAAAYIFSTTRNVRRDASSTCIGMIHQPRFDFGIPVDYTILNNMHGQNATGSNRFKIAGSSFDFDYQGFQYYYDHLKHYRTLHADAFTRAARFSAQDMQALYDYGDVHFTSPLEMVWAGLADTVDGRTPSKSELAAAGQVFCNRVPVSISLCK